MKFTGSQVRPHSLSGNQECGRPELLELIPETGRIISRCSPGGLAGLGDALTAPRRRSGHTLSWHATELWRCTPGA